MTALVGMALMTSSVFFLFIFLQVQHLRFSSIMKSKSSWPVLVQSTAQTLCFHGDVKARDYLSLYKGVVSGEPCFL